MSDANAISGFKRRRLRAGGVQWQRFRPDKEQQACCSAASGSVRAMSDVQLNPQASPPHALPRPPLSDAPPAGEAPIDCSTACDVAAVAREPLEERLSALRRLADGGTLSCAARPPPDEDQDISEPRWTLGAGAVDHLLGARGLAVDGLHEVKPALTSAGGCHAGDWAAALAFGLRLVLRRLSHVEQTGDGPALLWCQPRSAMSELGRFYAPGLKHLGIDPKRVIVVETARREDALWAMEEGLASGAVALVAGIVDDVGLTPARRLSLRAERHRTPCLLLTSPHAPATAATATRWQIARHRGARHPFDPRAPGALRLAVALERCRQNPLLSAAASFTLEWSDEAFCFDMASGLADRADGSRGRGRFAA